MPNYYRSDQSAVFVTFGEGPAAPNSSWSSAEGGDNPAPSTPMFPGGMAPMLNLGGFKTRGDMTCKRPWSDALFALHKYLDNHAGVTANVTYVVLDGNGNVVPGSDETYTGIVLNSMRPNTESKTNSEAEYTVVLGLNGPMT